MSGKVVVLAILLVTFVSGPVRAEGFGSNANRGWGTSTASPTTQPQVAAGKIVGYNGNFKLTVTSASAGTCPDGYAHQCASGTCECVEFSGSGNGSTFGKSSDVVAEITLDLNNQPGDPDGTCFPAFGFLSLTGTKENEVVDFVGAACSNFDNSSTFAGGFEFNQPSTVIFDAEGQTATGKFVSGSTFLFKLKGKACTGTGPCT